MNIKIIGAGLGGLAASCLLAKQGHDITILEKNSTAGGKINEAYRHNFRFDTGPSLLTMPFTLESLFKYCDAEASDYLNIQAIDPICRYFYQNGIKFDCFQDASVNIAQVQQFAPDDVQAYKAFQEYSATLYKNTKEAFLFNPLYSFPDLNGLNLKNFFRVDAFTTVSKRINQKFSSPELRQFFKRFTTYNGSSPFQAPATLNVIPHVELSLGGYYIDGGMYTLIEALVKLAKKMGVSILYDAEIKSIETKRNKVTGVTDKTGRKLAAEVIISNADAAETYLNLFDERKISRLKQWKTKKIEPSSSAFVLLLGIDKIYQSLLHHNIFFSKDYRQEFRQVFEKRIMPDNPTIYVSNTSYTNPEHAPAGSSNLFVLVNAPYLSNQFDWNKQKAKYQEFIIKELQKRGLTDLNKHITYSESITPQDFYQKYRSNKGSIYGTSSNSRLSAFLRPRNKCRSIKGLYLVGGSTHPGGGIPLVILSAFHTMELIDRYE